MVKQARWMTNLPQAGHSEYVREPRPVPNESQWRVEERRVLKTALELCISLLILTDWRKILLALGRADFTLNIFNVFIQIGLKDEKIVWKDTEAHQEQYLSWKS